MSPVSTADLVMSAPMLIVGFGACFFLLVDVFMGLRVWPRAAAAMAILLVAIIALGTFYAPYQSGMTAFGGFLYADIFTWFFSLLILGGTALSILVGMNNLADEGISAPGEFYTLLLMSSAGAMIFVSSAELITMFLGLETMSMALYCLCGAALGNRRSAESSLKYFLLGSFSSAVMLYGIALLYGLTGSTFIDQIAENISSGGTVMGHCALALLLIGFIFKVGAVPFHFWAPDVYEGAPTPVTAYMACVVKASAVGAALRVLWSGFGSEVVFWSGAIWYIAVFTMIVGNIVALRQRSLKRMLAYSSIAHAGYIMVGFLARGQHYEGGSAILYYLVVYTVMTMGAFAVVLAVTTKSSASPHPDDISRFHGLGYRNPFLGVAMSIFMLGLAGIPPGMAGLLGKFYIFSAAVKANFVGLAVIGVLCSAISSYYYLRIIVAMYFIGPDTEKTEDLADPSMALGSALTLCVVGTIFFGLFPSMIYEIASGAMMHF